MPIFLCLTFCLDFDLRLSSNKLKYLNLSQQTRDIDPMLDQCWATVYEAGRLQHWSNIGSMSRVCQEWVWMSLPTPAQKSERYMNIQRTFSSDSVILRRSSVKIT